MEHWLELDRAFPDQEDEVLAFHHADETVLLEMVTRGTHLGPLRGLPPTGRSFELRFICIFVFESDKLVCERVYFDTNTMFEQLGVASDRTVFGAGSGPSSTIRSRSDAASSVG